MPANLFSFQLEHDLSEGLPDGVIETQAGWVESKIVPGTDVFIKGKYDLLVKQPNNFV